MYGAQGLVGSEDIYGDYWVYHYDYRGSTVALTDIGGEIIDESSYSACGELLDYNWGSETPFLFNGKYGVMSDENGLYYLRARYYNPDIKRFINLDVLLGSIDEGQSLN
ncbi:MAG TPA: hypothetical protein GX520_04935, partial [Syntrophaceticus sp.]|nr:hypothetical protein [Syntrophaceticus sp.]